MDLEQKRLELHEILAEVLGSRFVYFQPPDGIVMQYPCIVYNRERANVTFANNRLYLFKQRYSVTLIDPEVDSDKIFKLASLQYSAHERWFAVDNLNHDEFTLYF